MSVKGTIASGRPTNAARNTIGVLRYLPTQRRAHTPFEFRRENLTEADMKKFWDQGRYRYGTPAYHTQGHYPSNKFKIETDEFTMIPRKQLEKFMPNIDLGSPSFVTPTSIMSARSGHRVTHDLLHSYDKYIGAMGRKEATVDHDNVDIFDKNRVGLHPDTISSRARMFRWFRRGPFFQENHYFIRSALRNIASSANPFVARVEAPMHTKIVRLAKEGHLKSACEEYRRLSFIPPVEVFRALTAACIPDGKLADAIAIFDDANARLRFVGRDFEVYRNVIQTAINADNADRVMWLVNVTEGTFTENIVIRAEFSALEKFDLYQRGLEFLLDKPGCEARAKELYDLMSRQNLLSSDLCLSEGAKMREELLAKSQTLQSEEGAASSSFSLVVPDLSDTAASLQKNSKDALEIVAKRMFRKLGGGANNNNSTNLIDLLLLPKNSNGSNTTTLGQRLAQIVSMDNVDIFYLLRLCRFLESENSDLLAENRLEEFAERAEDWILQLSDSARSFFAATTTTTAAAASNKKIRINNGNVSKMKFIEGELPYLPKSRPANAANNKGEFIRIAVDPKSARMNRNNEATNQAVTFYYNGAAQRFVEETFPSLDVDVSASKYLARQPVHKEKFVELFDNMNNNNDENSSSSSNAIDQTVVVVHGSIGADALRLTSRVSDASASSIGGRRQTSSSSSASSSASANASATTKSASEAQNEPSMEGHF